MEILKQHFLEEFNINNFRKLEVKNKLIELNDNFHKRKLLSSSFYQQLMEKGFYFNKCLLVELFPDGSSTYIGQLISQDMKVFKFDMDLDCSQYSLWEDITVEFFDKIKKNKNSVEAIIIDLLNERINYIQVENKITVKNRANRVLKKMVKGYRPYTDSNSYFVFKKLKMSEDDFIVGLYINDENDNTDTIIITNDGLYLNKEGEIRFIQYKEIIDVSYQLQEPKHSTKYLTIKSPNGNIDLLLNADKGRFSDIFEFSRFLNRVISDL